MSEDILGALTKLGTHACAEALLTATGGHHNKASFNTCLYDMKVKKLLRRFDQRDVGGKFVYGLPRWGEPGVPIAAPKVTAKVSTEELRNRLEMRSGPEIDIPISRKEPDMRGVDIDSVHKGNGEVEPEKPIDWAKAPVKHRIEVDDEPVPTIPVIPAIEPGIYRIRGTALLLQVKLNGAHVYRLGD